MPWTSQDKYVVGDFVRVRQGDGSLRFGEVQQERRGSYSVRFSDDGTTNESLKAHQMEICSLKAPNHESVVILYHAWLRLSVSVCLV